jgi:chain length determinant protein EpsF
VDFTPDPVSAVVYGGLPSPTMIATQMDVIKSDRVALRVVRNLKLAENPTVRAQWQDATDGQGSVEQWLVSVFSRQMDVVPSRESSVLTITYKAPDPRFAAGLANAFAEAYIQTSLELRVDPAKQYAGFFDQRSKEARDSLEKAQTRLSEFQRKNAIIASDERLDVENARLNELSSQLVALQAISAESRSRQVQAQGAQADRLQEVLNNPVIGALKADISRGEARLKELSTRYGDAHPQVQEIKANIAELRARMEAETRRVTSGVGVSNTINTSREAQVRAELEAQRAKVLRMKAVRDEGAVILRDIENAQRAYDAVVTRQTQSSLESQTTQSNVNILTQATPPVEPSSPRIGLNTALSVFIGLLLAAGVVMLLEMMDRRVRAAGDIVAVLGLPVVGIMPKPNAKRRRTTMALPRESTAALALPTPQGS